MTNKQRTRYQTTLEDYLKWRSGNFLRPVFKLSDSGDPVEIMWQWETLGRPLPEGCLEPELLADYVQGKKCRDWHIKEWRDGVEDKYFLAEEFMGGLGLTEENFESIFGRPIDRDCLEYLRYWDLTAESEGKPNPKYLETGLIEEWS